jgi:hypothetical protein
METQNFTQSSWGELNETPANSEQYVKVSCGKIIYLAHSKTAFLLYGGFPTKAIFNDAVMYLFYGIPMPHNVMDCDHQLENSRFNYMRLIYTTEPFTITCISTSKPIMVKYLGEYDLLNDIAPGVSRPIYNIRGDLINGE